MENLSTILPKLGHMFSNFAVSLFVSLINKSGSYVFICKLNSNTHKMFVNTSNYCAVMSWKILLNITCSISYII